MDNWTAPKLYYNNNIFAGCNLVVKFDCIVLHRNFNHQANWLTSPIKKIVTIQICLTEKLKLFSYSIITCLGTSARTKRKSTGTKIITDYKWLIFTLSSWLELLIFSMRYTYLSA